jgi:chemotaxis protein methyltransferase CheR
MATPAFDRSPAPAAAVGERPRPPLQPRPALVAIPTTPLDEAAAAADYAHFVARVRVLTGIDLSSYKAPQMQRRLLALATRQGAPTLRAFAQAMERDTKALEAFQNFFTINVSEFFRDPARWTALAEQVLPKLMQSPRRALRIWSAGCSIGAEPYTLAVLLDELYPGVAHTIFATDIDETTLRRAAGGAGYGETDLRNVAPSWRAKHFRQANDGSWSVTPALKSKITFRQHDMLREPAGQGFDLVVCRNVVIYFTDAAKQQLYGRFHDALRSGGVLFVGGTEVVSNARELGFTPWLTSFYVAGPRPANATRG